jgi:hypothetical protein
MIEGSVFIEGVRELCNCWRHFRTIRENDFLSLEANIFGPLNETREILFRLDAMAFNDLVTHTSQIDDEAVPMEKYLARASNKGFFTRLEGLLAPKGAAAGLFPVPFLTGGWSLVIETGRQSRVMARPLISRISLGL